MHERPDELDAEWSLEVARDPMEITDGRAIGHSHRSKHLNKVRRDAWPLSLRHTLLSALAAILVSAVVVGLAINAQPKEAPHILGQRSAIPKEFKPIPESPWAGIGANAPERSTTPLIIQNVVDWGAIGKRCLDDDPYPSFQCNVMPTDGSEAEREIYALGNSHSALFSNALLEAVSRRPTWTLRSQADPGCPFEYVSKPKTDCERLWETGTRYILDQEPDLVFVLATRSAEDPSNESLQPGLTEWIRMIEEKTDSEVIAIRDTPRFSFDMADCARDYGFESDDCHVNVTANDRAQEALDKHAREIEAAGGTWIDITSRICPDYVCRPAIAGVRTYFDNNHLSASYWRTLAPAVSEQLHPVVSWWPADPYRGRVIDRSNDALEPVT